MFSYINLALFLNGCQNTFNYLCCSGKDNTEKTEYAYRLNSLLFYMRLTHGGDLSLLHPLFQVLYNQQIVYLH